MPCNNAGRIVRDSVRVPRIKGSQPRRKGWLKFALLFVLSLSLSACKACNEVTGASTPMVVTISVTPNPPVVGQEAVVTVSVQTAPDEPPDTIRLQVNGVERPDRLTGLQGVWRISFTAGAYELVGRAVRGSEQTDSTVARFTVGPTVQPTPTPTPTPTPEPTPEPPDPSRWQFTAAGCQIPWNGTSCSISWGWAGSHWPGCEAVRVIGPETQYGLTCTGSKSVSTTGSYTVKTEPGGDTYNKVVQVTKEDPPPPSNNNPTVSCAAAPNPASSFATSVVTCNYADPDGDAGSWSASLSEAPASGGSLSATAGAGVASGTSFTFNYNTGAPCNATITVTVSDGKGGTKSTTVNVDVT